MLAFFEKRKRDYLQLYFSTRLKAKPTISLGQKICISFLRGSPKGDIELLGRTRTRTGVTRRS